MSVIKTPGKFEGEESYVPHFWDRTLDGCADDEFYMDGTPVSVFVPDDAERARWPELAGVAVVCLAESSDGFVSAKAFPHRYEYAAWRLLMEDIEPSEEVR